ncbi:MAG: hypothetical protein MHM6MM_005706 [Cercozoa sp. M6MM]
MGGTSAQDDMEFCQRLAQELVDTERAYVESLRVAHDGFFLRLLNLVKLDRELLSEPEIEKLFGSLPVIYAVSKQVLADLEQQRFDRCLLPGLYDVLADIAPFLKLYISYVDNHAAATQLATELRKRKDFSQFLDLEELCAGDTLESLLIRPVQRVPRYKLILEGLKKRCEKTENYTLKKHLPAINRACDAISQAAILINETVKHMEARRKVVVLQQRTFGDKVTLISSFRYYVRQALLKKIHSKRVLMQEHGTKYRFFLFNDCLVYASTSERAKFRGVVPLYDSNVSADTPKKKKYENRVFRIDSGCSGGKSFRVLCADQQERDEWIAALQQCRAELDRLHRSSGVVFDQDADTMRRQILRQDDEMSHDVSASAAALSDDTTSTDATSRPVLERVDTSLDPAGSPFSPSETSDDDIERDKGMVDTQLDMRGERRSILFNTARVNSRAGQSIFSKFNAQIPEEHSSRFADALSVFQTVD